MTPINTFILAVLQGLTEFLPVSSSGHLVIIQNFLGLKNIPVLFDLILHLGTVSAVIIVYYKIIRDILKDLFLWAGKGKKEKQTVTSRGNVKLFFYIFLSTVVTGIIGMVFKDIIKSFFYKPGFVPLFLFITGIILLTTKFLSVRNREIGQIKVDYPVVIGGIQAIAMLPGISRSGSTIAAGLFLGASRRFAGMYSFLLAVPSIFGASLFEFISTRNITLSSLDLGTISIAFTISFLTGYGSLKLLIRFLTKGKLYLFSFYCFAAGILGLIFIK